MSSDTNKPNEPSSQNDPHQPEYRLVQIENAQYTEADDEIDLVELIKAVWEGRKTIIWSVVAFIALGLFIALGTAEEYTSEVKLMPEVEEQASGGRLGGLAAQFGMGNIGGRTGTQGISPNLFPSVATSLPLMQQLMDHEVHVDRLDSTVTMYSYLTEHNHPDAVSIAQRYTVGLPFTLLGGIRGLFDDEDGAAENPPVLVTDEVSPVERIIRMNRYQWEVIESMRGRINTSFDQEDGTVSISVDMRDPEVAAEVADRVTEYIKEYVNAYNTGKARENLEFIEERYEEAKNEFEEAQEALARFRDENRGQLTARARTQEQRLQSEYDLKFNVYNSMAERLEEARIEVQENTRVVKALEPAAVPHQRSSPRRGLIMVVSVMLGGMIGLGIIFGRHMFHSIREKWEE